MHKDALLSWQAPEFRHYPKNLAWYITLGVILGLFIIYEIIQRDFFGALSVVIIGLFLFIFARMRPKTVTISLTPRGLHVEDTHIPYKQIRHFWIVNNDNHRIINLETTAYLNRHLVLQLEDQDPEEVRNLLLEQVPEHHETEETLTQKIAHRIRF
jgi:hypothetical protein